MTWFLKKYSYFPSFNIPYFKKITEISGFIPHVSSLKTISDSGYSFIHFSLQYSLGGQDGRLVPLGTFSSCADLWERPQKCKGHPDTHQTDEVNMHKNIWRLVCIFNAELFVIVPCLDTMTTSTTLCPAVTALLPTPQRPASLHEEVHTNYVKREPFYISLDRR